MVLISSVPSSSHVYVIRMGWGQKRKVEGNLPGKKKDGNVNYKWNKKNKTEKVF